ncbi:hypothetical protein K435DRAFT_800986 [Dendrothele bispora CBS 962.96]|uniref:Uncharacterized protein n=1 Tax=Dendrothele bispora (strain CBS 962.96) TaxID=1314807 RepID=A0A4S8LQQ3_DENBC|nr:hypothetical protein K435DRAFT_800986 [Dendrothele bispora CBS 962.96]
MSQICYPYEPLYIMGGFIGAGGADGDEEALGDGVYSNIGGAINGAIGGAIGGAQGGTPVSLSAISFTAERARFAQAVVSVAAHLHTTSAPWFLLRPDEPVRGDDENTPLFRILSAKTTALWYFKSMSSPGRCTALSINPSLTRILKEILQNQKLGTVLAL